MSHHPSRQVRRKHPSTAHSGIVWSNPGACGQRNGFTADEHEASKLHYLVGYLDKIKEHNSTQFVPMSQAAGSTSSHGTAIGGVRYLHNEFSVGLFEYYTPDVLNIVYAATHYVKK
jgi:hypothetical protein